MKLATDIMWYWSYCIYTGAQMPYVNWNAQVVAVNKVYLHQSKRMPMLEPKASDSQVSLAINANNWISKGMLHG